MTWTIEYIKSVQKTVKKIDPPTRKRIRKYLENHVATLKEPRQLGKQLKGQFSELWRYRIGDHRVICEIQDDKLVILVVRIGSRKNIYKTLS